MPNLRPLLTATVLGALVVLGVNGVAVAATGHPVLLGRFNNENQPTRITTSGTGPALRLNVKAGQAPLSVNTTTKVGALNADLLDGVHASALANRAYTYSLPTAPAASSLTIHFPGLPAGSYLASYAVTALTVNSATVADCAFGTPAGFQLANRSTFASSFAAVSATGIIDARTAVPTFTCFFNGGSASWNNSQPNYSSVTFLRVDAVGATASTASAAKAQTHARTTR